MIVPMRTAEEKQLLAQYLAFKMGCTAQELVGAVPFEIVAVARDGYPVGAVLYINYRQVSIEMACAGEPGWLTRANLRDLFRYPFVQLGCYTVITTVKRSNTVARKFNEKLGFTTLGVIESGLGRGEDIIVNTMTRPQCKWLTPADYAAVAARVVRSAAAAGEHGRASL
jgi:RimJ/RimL family protein N-acetyltransferase